MADFIVYALYALMIVGILIGLVGIFLDPIIKTFFIKKR